MSNDTTQLTLFHVDALDPETRIVVQQEDKEYDQNISESGSRFIRACHNLKRIHEALSYKRPGFVEYCQSKPGLTKTTAYRMIDVAKMFPNLGNIQAGPSALYLLAAPSTPEPARIEALQRAEHGEVITHQTARDIVSTHKNPPIPFVQDDEDEDDQEEAWNNRVYRGGDAYCKYCYTTHSDWQQSGDHDGIVWICERCDHAMRDEFMVVEEDAEPLTAYELQAAQQYQERYGAAPAETVAIFSAENVEWYTPQAYIEAARATMGGIDLDPASNPTAQARIQAAHHYTKDDDGLAQRWHGRVWLNPPYGVEGGKALAGKWAHHLIAQYESGAIEQAVLLVNAVIDSKWFDVLWRFPICFTNHRIRFELPDGAPADANKSPIIGSAIVYMGENVAAFVREFSQFGAVVTRLTEYDGAVLTELEVRA